MPDSDLPELDAFAMDLTHPMLPAAEVRRRGDRQRRRRTALVVCGGVLAVAIAVGIPATTLSANGGGRDIRPAPAPSPTPDDGEPAWVTSIPADFPLSDGFPEPAERRTASLPNMKPNCGTFLTGLTADNLVVSHAGESEGRAQRELILFSFETSAKAAMDQARAGVDACLREGSSGDGTEAIYATVPVDFGTEDSFAWSQQFRDDGGLLSQLTLVLVARTGNAVYIESSYTAAGGDEVVAAETERLTQNSNVPLQSLCLFAANPC
jgi:hypothetical protein